MEIKKNVTKLAEKILQDDNMNRGLTAQIVDAFRCPFGPSLKLENYKLGNGLKVIFLEDHSAPVVCLQTWFSVGSRMEKPGKTGICHLFEHLMFGETKDYSHGMYDRVLEEAGAESNAATFLDWTYYHINAPRDALQMCIRLESQRMKGLILQDSVVNSEKEVVANERRQRVDDDVDGSVNELLFKEAYKIHGYGIPTIGWMEDILNFTTEDCISFYETYYAPNNATLVIVGDLDPTETIGWIQDAYGFMKSSVLPIEEEKLELPQKEERVIRTSKQTPTHKLAIGYHGPAMHEKDHDILVVFNEILMGGRSSRCERILVHDLEVAIEVRGWMGSFRDPSLYEIVLTAREGKTVEQLLEAFDRILVDILEKGVTLHELERAKARLELATLHGLESVSGKAEQIGFFETVLGNANDLFEKLDFYRQVNEGDILQTARRYLFKMNRTIIQVIPNEGLPNIEENLRIKESI